MRLTEFQVSEYFPSGFLALLLQTEKQIFIADALLRAQPARGRIAAADQARSAT